MDLKKTPKANLEDKKLIFVLLGLVFSLSITFIALEWSQQDVTKHEVMDMEMEFEEELDIQQTTQQELPPPPPPPAPEVVVELNVVEDEVETKSVDFTSEIDEQTAIVVQAPVAAPVEEEDDQVVFQIVETMPEFPGGQQALFKYLSENVKYPVIAQENGIQGRVICQFTVNKDGSIVDIIVVRSAGDASLDKEAVRVIKSMPNWHPGKQRGKPVRVKYTVPVNFRLQ